MALCTNHCAQSKGSESGSEGAGGPEAWQQPLADSGNYVRVGLSRQVCSGSRVHPLRASMPLYWEAFLSFMSYTCMSVLAFLLIGELLLL